MTTPLDITVQSRPITLRPVRPVFDVAGNIVRVEVLESRVEVDVTPHPVHVTLAATQQACVIRSAVVNVAVTKGRRGEQGAPGSGSGPAYTHTQTDAQSSWTVAHQLGRKPLVDVHVSDEQVIARVTFPNSNSALVEFNAPANGRALCF